MTAASNEVEGLIKRLRRGADHLESEGDLGMPFLLREAADALAHSDPRPVAEGLREAAHLAAWNAIYGRGADDRRMYAQGRHDALTDEPEAFI